MIYCGHVSRRLNKRVMSKVADKRLSIEIAALRQPLWRAQEKQKEIQNMMTTSRRGERIR